MNQLFGPSSNTYARLMLTGILLGPLLVLLIGGVIARSGYATGQGRFVDQTVPFSHKHHAGDLGIDCRYCHTGVEKQADAVVPPTHTCMTCHSQLYTDADMLAPVRKSLAEGKPLEWKRVNRLPDYVYFDHHVHVKNGVPCAACHGDVRTMPLMRQARSLSMGWCVSCHRDPEDKIVEPHHVFDSAPYAKRSAEDKAFARSRMLAIAHHGRTLTECSICHR